MNLITPEIFEMLFLVCFGLAWPTSIYKSLISKTAKGKSVVFLFTALVGYFFGIISKFLEPQLSFVVWFYFLNAGMILLDIILTFRNRHWDRVRNAESR